MRKQIYFMLMVLIISLVTSCGYQKGTDMKSTWHFDHMNEVITKDFKIHETDRDLKIKIDAKVKEGMMTITIFDPDGNKVWERSGDSIKDMGIIKAVKGEWKTVLDIQNARKGDIKIRVTNKAF